MQEAFPKVLNEISAPVSACFSSVNAAIVCKKTDRIMRSVAVLQIDRIQTDGLRAAC